MSDLQPKNVLAILCSDIHLSHKPPVGRSAEPNWYQAMDRQLSQLRKLQKRYKCPVICAGDVFDRWNSPAELINFAIDSLPQRFYSVSGQHDQPNHRYDDIHKSAYYTLESAGVMEDISSGSFCMKEVKFHGFGYGVGGSTVDALIEQPGGSMNVAVVHAYCWRNKATAYPGAPRGGNLKSWKKKLEGYDAVVFGDNHIGFYDKDSNIFNCGTFMRRKVDDSLDTYVGALLDTGEIYPLKLDNSEDKWIHQEDEVRVLERDWGIREFIEDLSQLSGDEFDFAGRVLEFCDNNRINDQTKQVILEALEG